MVAPPEYSSALNPMKIGSSTDSSIIPNSFVGLIVARAIVTAEQVQRCHHVRRFQQPQRSVIAQAAAIVEPVSIWCLRVCFPQPAESRELAVRERLTMWRHVATLSNMKTIGIRELKNRLSEVVRSVKAGEHILVTDRGAVVAE